jgi:hypothetical protein
MMRGEPEMKPIRRRRKRAARPCDPPTSDKVAKLFVAGMAGVGLACLAIGSFRHEPELGWFLRALCSLILGISFVSIGLLELEWLERIVWIVELAWLSTFWWIVGRWSGSLFESELVGRRRAVVFG